MVTRRSAGRLLLRVGAVLATVTVLWLVTVWPPPSWYRSHFPRETAFMAMRRDYAGAEYRVRYRPVPLGDIAPAMRNAVLVSEDHRFYVHGGIDYIELLKAMGYRRDSFAWSEQRDRSELWRSLGRVWTRRDDVRGASTLSMQLAKNLYLSPSRNPLRKVKEALTAWRLEQALGKDRILELYLNVAELGPGIWGVEAASQAYYRRSARRLNMDQAAMLAASLPSPLRANAGYRADRIRWRQQLILRRMQGETIIIPRAEVEIPPLPPLSPVAPEP